MNVAVTHCQYLKENQLDRLDNDHGLLENYHPARMNKVNCLFNVFDIE